MNLCLDSMDILKFVLLIVEAVLLTDCARGKVADSKNVPFVFSKACYKPERPRH